MRIIDIVSEARRNPDHSSQKATRINTLDKLKEYTDGNKEYFVTFSDLPRTGINPQSEFKTPIGIYCYPLSEFRDLVHEATETVDIFPYAADRPFMYILEEKNKPLQEIEEYNEDDWGKDKEKLSKLIDKPTEYIEAMLEDEIEEWKDGSPITKLWRFTRFLSKGDKQHIKWNKILRELGYSGFIDRDKSIIHDNEPIQAFFLSSKHFDVVEKIDNKSPNVKINDVYYKKTKTLPDELKIILKKMRKASSDEDIASIIIKSKYKHTWMNYIDLPESVKHHIILKGGHVPTVSDETWKKLISDKTIVGYGRFVEKPTLSQLQYALDNVDDIKKISIGHIKQNIDKLKFREEHYDEIVSFNIAPIKKINILGEDAFKEKYLNIILRHVRNHHFDDIENFIKKANPKLVDSNTFLMLLHTTDTNKKYNNTMYQFLIKALNNNYDIDKEYADRILSMYKERKK